MEQISITQHDRYYDTPLLTLWKRRGYLRLRSEEGEHGRERVTYRRTTRGVDPPFEIIEVTAPFSDMRRLVQELVKDTEASLPSPSAMGPVEMVESMGMAKMLAARTDRRRIRVEIAADVYLRINLDVVTFGSLPERHAEIEVEMSDPTVMPGALGPALAELHALLKGERWAKSSASKLERGLAQLRPDIFPGA